MAEYNKAETLIQLRGDAYKKIIGFDRLLEDEESKAEFKPVFDAFRAFEVAVQKLIQTPHINHSHTHHNREVFEFQDNFNNYTNPEVFVQTQHEPTFLELSDMDINIEEIAIFQKTTNKLILKSGFSIELTTNDAARVRHFLQTRRFK